MAFGGADTHLVEWTARPDALRRQWAFVGGMDRAPGLRIPAIRRTLLVRDARLETRMEESVGVRRLHASRRRRCVGRMGGLLVAVLCLGDAGATSVRPLAFDTLCERAALIFRGRVVAVGTVEREGAAHGAPIVTEVHFAVERLLKGSHLDATATLTLPGGTVEGRTLRVPGVPSFTVGERAIVFVAPDGVAFAPVVGLDQGVFRIEHDPALGQDVIAAADVRRLQRAEAQAAGNRNRRERFSVGAAALPLQVFEESIDDIVH